MVGNKLNRKVAASTIIEVVISMVVIVLVFGIAMMIFTNVLRFSLSEKQIRAQAILQETMLKAEHSSENPTQTSVIDDFRIEQEAKNSDDNAELIEIHLTAFDQNQQKVADLQKIISKADE